MRVEYVVECESVITVCFVRNIIKPGNTQLAEYLFENIQGDGGLAERTTNAPTNERVLVVCVGVGGGGAS